MADKNKTFGTSSTGKVLEILCVQEKLTWTVSVEKLTPLVLMLSHVKNTGGIEKVYMMSLNGCFYHYMLLVQDGTGQRSFLLKMQNSRDKSDKKVLVGS